MGGGGERVPIIKYDARAGRVFRVDRTQNAAGAFDSANVEITAAFQAVFDLENIELGWLNFPTNAAPDIQTARYGQPLPARPSPQHKSGFRIYILLGKGVGGDVREMASNSQASIKGMDRLHDAYLAGVKQNPGKLPVIQLPRTEAIVSTGKAATSTNYEPLWEVVAWVDRPAKLAPEAVAALRMPVPEGAQGNGALPLSPPPAPVLASVSDDF
jgi:hypothetical protein